ncbi:hypothetical protein Ctob_000212 [Chrysochromulina tobinii]|uniref:Uncharacterized protein n=1 Tax=Chrysochromulina tobinii TaxID=1460289 RepID=A0A0M0J9S7_9EUKA|nr:hypothetical protein Ctob_000212 [Chrysochromulina tobinii]|eukprot:KOO23326.1 hypothetical protein Ctob_000212 [Chrysochromulina sp. CCMP291]
MVCLGCSAARNVVDDVNSAARAPSRCGALGRAPRRHDGDGLCVAPAWPVVVIFVQLRIHFDGRVEHRRAVFAALAAALRIALDYLVLEHPLHRAALRIYLALAAVQVEPAPSLERINLKLEPEYLARVGDPPLERRVPHRIRIRFAHHRDQEIEQQHERHDIVHDDAKEEGEEGQIFPHGLGRAGVEAVPRGDVECDTFADETGLDQAPESWPEFLEVGDGVRRR